ncbi:MAG: SLC13 family permease, partial [Akkermansia sp.]
KESFIKTPQAFVVYITFVLTIALWVMGSGVHGLNSNVIAFIPITVFCVTGVITEKDLGNMNWSVLWLVAGGFALGLALQETGLAKDLIDAIPFHTWSIVGLLVGAGFICMFMSTFMSNTATANLLIPILATLAGGMIGAGVIDNAWGLALLVGVALSASMGMALPISTPPNAIAYATGFIKTKDMAITGTILCMIGFVVACATVVFCRTIGFFG